MPVVIYNLLLEFARMYVHSSSLERVLESLGDAVTEGSKIIDRARDRGSEDHFDSVCDEEAGVLESLVGTAFVVAQAQITGVVSSIKRLHKQAEKDGVLILGITGTKEEIMRLQSTIMPGTNYSRIQVIDAFANYFKHHDEWTVPWSRLNKQSMKTAKVIQAAGARESNTGNLRTGLETLGIDSDLLVQLHGEVARWANSVVKTYRAELQSKGLLRA